MPKDNRSRRYSHYSHSFREDRERDRERSPRDRDRDRSPHRDRDRERDYYRGSPSRRSLPAHPYSSTYPPHSGYSYMSEQRRGGFARGRGGDQQRRPPPPQSYQPPPAKPDQTESGSSWAARGGPQPGYSKAPTPAQAPTGGRATTRIGSREEGASTTEEGKKEKSAGRGNWRGGRIIPSELVVTRDKELRNKKGSSGTPVTLKTNYFKLLSVPDWCLNQYSVKFEPNEEQTSTRKGLMKEKKDELKAYIFDGSILYSTEKYPDPLEFVVERKTDKSTVKITITFTHELSKSDYQYLQFFNILMRKCYEQLHLQLVGRNYFDSKAMIPVVEHGLQLWPGYITSIRQHERDIMMNAEITYKVMRQETLLDILNQVYRADRQNFADIYMNQVIGLVVLTDYNNNTYRITDVDFDVTPKSTFNKKDGTTVTYKDYYKDRYNIVIHQDNQPMLVTLSKPKDRRGGNAEMVYLVPELCRATGITDAMRNDRRMMKELAVYTRVSPAVRIQKLLEFNQRLYSEPEIIKEFDRWHLKLDKHLAEVPGRILGDEIIYVGQSKTAVSEKAEWTKGLRNNEMFAQCELRDWFIIFPRGKNRDVSTFVNCLSKVGAGFRLRIEAPQQIELHDDKSSDYTNEIERIMSRHMPQMICCIAMNNRADRYSAIKKKCAVDRPVPSQVVLWKNLSKGLSVATKIAIQMNCKLGGAPWTVNIPLDGLMIVGFDVCHDTNTKGTDFGAMVASLDKYCTRYYSTVSSHASKEELSNYFATNLVKALRKYEAINRVLPTRIIVYRDGVGDGDVGFVVEHEISSIKRALNDAYGDEKLVKFAFILVTKRINTRMFYMNGNPPPGTVVDDVITNPLKFDFFLVSQFVNQGTVTPTAYSVLHSTCGLAPDKIQRLTFKLTHMYYNWCGTVRVPAPCQYAHKLAFLVAQAIHRAPDPALDSILHFL